MLRSAEPSSLPGVSVTDALADIAALVANGQLTAAQAQLVTLAATQGGGPAMRAATGQPFGQQLASQNNAAAVSGVMTSLTTSLGNGSITASQLVGILAGMATVTYPAVGGGAAAAGGIAQLVLSGQLSLAQVVASLQSIQSAGSLIGSNAVAGEVALLNPQVLAGTLPSFVAFNAFQTFYNNHYNTIDNLLLQLAVAAQLPPTSASFVTIIADISSYIANNGVTVGSVVSASLASANSLASAAATGALIGKIESAGQAIFDITNATLSPQREAAALLGLLADVTTADNIATIRTDRSRMEFACRSLGDAWVKGGGST